ncbi:phage tail protein I [Paenibacillus psychroresistens]|uniref:Phage tail protein I n=1 Tax=Paenibacillus psychroresistens TaxID=1778678 RepID=A0A6B8RWW1_9BACL|nr:phage tail protein I [Paenibacillus psychroresistens]QGR00086.1 phage tail protein I [Paenibacillus psychroresistens]
MRDIYSVSLLGILPPSLTSDPQVQAAAQAIDAELQIVSGKIKDLDLLYSIDQLDDVWLDELAWALHVDFYDKTLLIEQKRALINNSDRWHRRKGTPSAVEELLETMFGDGTVVEWYDFGGDPYTFRVTTVNSAATDEDAQQFLDAINSVKNVRSRLESIQICVSDDLNLYFGNVIYIGDFITAKQVT